MPKVTFETDSDAEPLLIVSRHEPAGAVNERVNLQPAGVKVRSGSVIVPANEKVVLTWIFVGSPGTKFKITLKPKEKITLTRADNPIESSISTHRTVNSGSDQFEVKP